LAQTPAEIVRVDVEDVTDALEGEGGAAICRLHPCARLIEQEPRCRFARPTIPAIAVDGVPEHRQHEPALPLERLAPRERRTEEDVRLERRLEEIIHRHLVMLRISGTGRPAGAARVVS